MPMSIGRMNELHFRQLSDGSITLSIDTSWGEIVLAVFDNVVMFSMFIKDCNNFLDMCTGEDIPRAFREAFK